MVEDALTDYPYDLVGPYRRAHLYPMSVCTKPLAQHLSSCVGRTP
jgi:hypothetical protein